MQIPQLQTVQNYSELTKLIADFVAADEKTRAELIHSFGAELLRSAEQGKTLRIGAFIDQGFEINYQDRRSGETALHYACASNARDVVRLLVKAGRCDYLLRDNFGRLASELAYVFGGNPAIARLLGNKERKQAYAQGIKLTRRPPASP